MIEVALIGVAGLAALAFATWRLNRRFGHYAMLPHHFDLRGRPDAFGSPWLILRLVPGILVFSLLLVLVLNVVFYDPLQHAAMMIGMLVVSASVVAAMMFINKLLVRWEKAGAKLDP